MKTCSLVFLHGFLGSSLNWGRILTALKQRKAFEALPMMAVDLLWHSRNPGANASLPDLHAELTEDFLRQIAGLPPPYICVAHSFGLRPLILATENRGAAEFPLWIVEDSSPGLSEAGYKQLRDILLDPGLPFESRKQASLHFHARHPGSPEMAQFLMTNLSQDAEGKWNWRFNQAMLLELLEEAKHRPLWESFADYSGEIHLLYGERSHVVLPEALEKMRLHRQAKQLALYHFRQSAHWLHHEESEYFAKTVESIVDKWRKS
jgi:pimeloyl-ACP methyl ester carboxylesterase